MIAVDPSYQFLACQYLREQLEILMRELHGVRSNEDIGSRSIRRASLPGGCGRP